MQQILCMRATAGENESEGMGEQCMFLCARVYHLCVCVCICVVRACVVVCVCVCCRQTADHSLKTVFNIKQQHANDNWVTRHSLHRQNKQTKKRFCDCMKWEENGAGTPQGDISRWFILIKGRTSPVLSPSAIHSMIKWSSGVQVKLFEKHLQLEQHEVEEEYI